MESTAPRDFPNLPGQPRPDDATEKLRQESSQLPAVAKVKHLDIAGSGKPEATRQESSNSQMRGLRGDMYTVSSGDTLSSIARKMLKLRGETTSAQNIYDEVNRIVDLNSEKLPGLLKNPNKIRAGMSLQVWDKETGPDPTCRWKDWEEAEAGRITVAVRCESVFAGKDTRVVVTPGARAVLTPGSYGFIAPKAYARALEGSYAIAVGGEVIDDGGELKVLHQDAKVRSGSAKRRSSEIGSSALKKAVDSTTTTRRQDTMTEEQILEVPPI